MSKKTELPREEMARLIRAIAGARNAGETDEQLRLRAARRLGISASRAKVFWYEETDNIRSDEMDRARSLALTSDIDGAVEALERLEGRVLAVLRDRICHAIGLDPALPAADLGASADVGADPSPADRQSHSARLQVTASALKAAE